MLVALKQKGQLAQYMQQYKSDPYMISLASFVNATAEAAQPLTAPQQPKVVDQELAKMEPQQPQMPQAQAQPMPEDVGIGALPAPNMQGMASGGIVAFGDGGEVPRFQAGGVYVGEGGEYSADPLTAEELGRVDPLAKLRAMAKWAGRNVERDPVTGEVTRKAAIAAPVMGPAVSAAYPDETRRGAAANLLPAAPGVKPPPAVGDGKGVASLGGAPRAAAAPAGLSYLDQLKKTQAAMGPAVNPEQAAMEKLIAERNLGATEAKKELETDIASRADQFKGREERIGKREAELGKQKDSNTGMAFLEAGLAMMQSKGRGLAGIAEGAGVGLKQYQSGIKDLKAAQEKLDDARDRTDELKQNQSTMDKREVRAANKDIRDASMAGQQSLIDARMKIYGENKADARAAVTSDMAVSQAALDRQNRIQVASMPGDQQRMLTALGGKGGLEAGLAKMQEIQTDKTGAAYAKLFTETVAEANKAGTTPPTAAQFAASLRQLSAAMNPTKVPGAVDVATPGRT
jgi:hypothetical protein